MKSTEWMSKALCASHPEPDIWFAKEGTPEAREAAEICADCKVVAECRSYAKTASRGLGVWAGKLRVAGEAERQQPIAHGTARGYRAHIRRGVPVCVGCREAHRIADRLTRERGRR